MWLSMNYYVIIESAKISAAVEFIISDYESLFQKTEAACLKLLKVCENNDIKLSSPNFYR